MAKVVFITVIVILQLILLIPLYLYFPRNVPVSKSDIMEGPTWSGTFLDRKFVKVKIEVNGKLKTIRLVQ